MPDLYLLMNHVLTPLQEKQARELLSVVEIFEPPPALREKWRQVPPDVPAIVPFLDPFRAWLSNRAVPGDYVLIQGDFGACFLMVRFAMEKGFVPIYSTTTRRAVEEHREDGSVVLTHTFRHRRFRRYGE